MLLDLGSYTLVNSRAVSLGLRTPNGRAGAILASTTDALLTDTPIRASRGFRVSRRDIPFGLAISTRQIWKEIINFSV